ncbi:MAG TPA: DUF4926 domain-containing protein [Chloroflexota bacterium]|nr:DUF4926 domain-containing protein [Chloroflexota bacterium]HUM68677.1 DUF4926 domain-containing protein [Chloroflexota bacterium]
MTYRLFEQVVLRQDIPEKNLRRGDVATIVEHHPMHQGEDGYSLELFNGIGETIAVITVPESAIQPLSANTILHVRDLKVPA